MPVGCSLAGVVTEETAEQQLARYEYVLDAQKNEITAFHDATRSAMGQTFAPWSAPSVSLHHIQVLNILLLFPS